MGAEAAKGRLDQAGEVRSVCRVMRIAWAWHPQCERAVGVAKSDRVLGSARKNDRKMEVNEQKGLLWVGMEESIGWKGVG